MILLMFLDKNNINSKNNKVLDRIMQCYLIYGPNYPTKAFGLENTFLSSG